MLIDSHAHLDEYEDRDAVIARAKAAGLVHVVVVGQWPDPRRALELARTDRGFFSATAGIPPHDAAHADDAAFAKLERLFAHPEVVAGGECGMDAHYHRSPP